MRIAITTNEFVSEPKSYDGGVANYLYRLAKALKEFGHEPIIFVSAEKNESLFYKDIEVQRVSFKHNKLFKLLDKVTRFKYLNLLNKLWNSYYINRAIKVLHKQKPIDIIQFTSYESSGFFKPSKIPSVLWMCSYLKFWNQADEKINKTFRERQLEILDFLTHKRANAIFAPSHFLSDKVSKIIHKPVDVLETPYFYEVSEDNDKVYKEIIKKTGEAQYILYFGRLGIWKGLVELSNIIFDFLKKNTNVYFVLIGKDKGYKGKSMINNVIEKAGEYSNRIIYYSNITHEFLYPVIKGAYAVVLPSRIENVSNATIESMANKKIVLGTDGVSFEELITDGVSGFLFNRMDENDLLNKMNLIMTLEKNKKAEIEERAYERILSLRPENTVKRHIQYYEENIKSQKRN